MRDLIRGATLIFGLLAALLSLPAALLLAFLIVSGGSGLGLAPLTVLFSVVALGVGLGLPLAAAAWRSWQRRPSPRLHLPPAWWLFLIFLGVLALGQLSLGAPFAGLVLPPLHVAASFLPPLLLVAAILPPMQRAGAGLTRRNLVIQFSYGALVATLLAILLETMAIVAVIALAGLGLALLPGSEAILARLTAALDAGLMTADPLQLLRSLLSPGIVLGVALLAAVIVPLLEEIIKSLGAVINGMVRGSLTRAHAFTFGVMAGVGFSFTEALFYAAQQLPHAWVNGVVLRGLTAVIHAAAAGLFALGWYEVMARRPARFWLYAAGGVGIHGLWNGLSGLLLLAGLAGLDGGATMQQISSAGAVVGTALLGLTWLAALGVLFYQTRRLSAELSSSEEVVLEISG